MPPGTGDVAFDVGSVPAKRRLDGAITVTTPQQVAAIDVVKSMEMFRKVNVPLLGTHRKHRPTSSRPIPALATTSLGVAQPAGLGERLGVPLLGQIPLGMSIRAGGDDGRPAVLKRQPRCLRRDHSVALRNASLPASASSKTSKLR
jgi:ATP-binding protein involved in chromosome partitioning